MNSTQTHIALMRGINVGGRNKLPMKDLAAMFEVAGCADVRTYIQSGNVLFSAPEDLATRVPGLVGTAIAEQFGYRIPIILRSAERFAAIVAANPFVAAGAEDRELHVAFLADAPARAVVARLDGLRSSEEELAAAGAEVYLRLPGGVARTKLSNANFDRLLDTTSTMRNWRTTKKLLELAG